MGGRWIGVACLPAVVAAGELDFVYPALASDRSALHHFRRYAVMEQKIAAAVPDTLIDGLHPDLGSFSALAAQVDAHSQRRCGESGQAWSLHSAAYDSNNVQHAVLARSGTGHWQYVALAGDSLLVADPPLCPASRLLPQQGGEGVQRQLLEQSSVVDDRGHFDRGLDQPAEFTVGERLTLLNPVDDGLVEDCLTAIHKTAKERCNKDFEVKVHRAQFGIIDGMDVRLSATLTDPKTGRGAEHKLHCFFQVPQSSEESKVAEKSDFVPMGDSPGQLTYQVSMSVDLCEAATSAPTDFTTQLFEGHALGELSRYRGYRHVYDHIVKLFQNTSVEVPPSIDFRTKYSKCFPNGGRNIVKNQGTCGSCWAMAASSALMANMCIVSADNNTVKNMWRRFEVSAQHVMTCNEQKKGCDGGHAMAAQTAFATHGIAPRAEVPYRCGGGDATKHFELDSGNCTSYPWGSSAETTCPAVNPKWHLEGVYSVSGEAEMMKALASGYSLYVSMAVPKSFPPHKSGIYVPKPEAEDPILGAHAVVCLGYGSLNGRPYWLLQNSWGPWWGEDGFFRMPRGNDTLGIEETALVFRGYSDGHEDALPAAPHNRVTDAECLINTRNWITMVKDVASKAWDLAKNFAGEAMDWYDDLPEDQGNMVLAALAGLVLLCCVCSCVICCRCCCRSSPPTEHSRGYRGVHDHDDKAGPMGMMSTRRVERPMPKEADADDSLFCCGRGTPTV